MLLVLVDVLLDVSCWDLERKVLKSLLDGVLLLLLVVLIELRLKLVVLVFENALREGERSGGWSVEVERRRRSGRIWSQIGIPGKGECSRCGREYG